MLPYRASGPGKAVQTTGGSPGVVIPRFGTVDAIGVLSGSDDGVLIQHGCWVIVAAQPRPLDNQPSPLNQGNFIP